LPEGLSTESAGCEALRASRPADGIRSVVEGAKRPRQRKAEGLGNDNRTMIKIKTFDLDIPPQKTARLCPVPLKRLVRIRFIHIRVVDLQDLISASGIQYQTIL
jgi:hypothetical protein